MSYFHTNIQQAASLQTATKNRLKNFKFRPIHHPLFGNLSYKEAEERLRREGKGSGEVVFRPSSKGGVVFTIY